MFDTIKELIEEQKYVQLKKEIIKLDEADIAELLEELNNENLIKVFRLLPKDIAAETFSFLDVDVQQTIINSLTATEAASIIDNMFADDATDLIEEMPSNVVKKILAKTTSETRKDINLLLNYKEDSAGSIMTVEFLDIKSDYTISKAIERIRRIGTDKETLDFCYVLDNKRRLLGTLSLKQIILSPSDKLVEDIMEVDPISVTTNTDQEEVALLFQKYDITVMPVVDSENRLVGIITIDDVVDIMQEETTEDIEKMAAITPSDKPYMRTGVFETWKKRIPWLLILMISATFTGKIIQSFESGLAACVILTSFIPMLMDTGGNAGGQASVTIIRGLSLNEIEFKDILRIIWKEFRVALLIGLTLAVCNFAKLLIVDGVNTDVALVVCFTLVLTVIIAKVVGCSLPLAAKKIGFDPAVMASPFITTIVDALSLVVYFQLAKMILNI